MRAGAAKPGSIFGRPCYPIDMYKPDLRSRLQAGRRALSPQARLAASRAACRRLLDLPALVGAGTVALYAARPEEADPSPALEPLAGRGIRLLLPRVSGIELDFVAISVGTPLRPGPRGVLEPDGEPVEAAAIDVIVVPGLGFGRDGGRLGSGGGHYDRALARLPASTTRIGFCFACQLVERLPQEPHDQAVDLIVTELEVWPTSARKSPPAAL